MQGEKQVLRLEDIKMIKPPRYKELSLKVLLADAMQDDQLRKYLPEPK